MRSSRDLVNMDQFWLMLIVSSLCVLVISGIAALQIAALV
ncbi:hypothetical protein ACVILK_000756 [Bradyrhizobium embrapense]